MKYITIAALSLCSFVLSACNTEPAPPPREREAMKTDVNAALKHMEAKDDSLRDFLNRAYGYAIFPEIGKGALVVGGAYGRGEVYRGNQLIGYAEIKAGSVGLQAGGETFSELLVFGDEKTFNDFTNGKFSFSANAAAVLVKAGAGAKAQFDNGVAVFIHPRGGAMVDLSIAGQQFNFRPLSGGRINEPDTRPAQP